MTTTALTILAAWLLLSPFAALLTARVLRRQR